MNIVLAGEVFPPDLGGPATYTPKIAAALHDKGHGVKVVCYSDANPNNDQYTFEVFRVPFSRFKFGHHFKYTKRLWLLAKGSDLIYAQGPVSSGLPAVFVAKLQRKKIVIKVVGDYAWEQARSQEKVKTRIDSFQKTNQKGFIGLLQKIEKYTTRYADKVIVPSEYLKSIVVGWGVSSNNVLVIYNAAPKFSSFRKESREYDTIVTMGRLVSWKGFEGLIAITPTLIRENPRFRLLILGGGPLRSKLQNQIDELRMENFIRIKRVIPQERDTILSEARLFVLNTDYEGLSHALLEVMAAGVPIITTNSGGNPELIDDGKNGMLVDFNDLKGFSDAIVRLTKDGDRRRKFVNESKARVRSFSQERMIRETIQSLETI